LILRWEATGISAISQFCLFVMSSVQAHFQELPAEQQVDLVQLLRQAYPKAQFSKDEAIHGPPLLSFGPCAVI